ncbi:MAG TPA: kelch repeat-containing protein, partial [candidate division Zixibacteria bacterium]|nr:kelch repeat-containing protein [candidate division Zixibacteria bacterium]
MAVFANPVDDNGAWQKITSPIPQPGARYNSATNSAVYASSINSMVFFGGYDLITFQSDAWKLDLATLQWSPLPSSSPGPPGRVSQTAVYDAAHDRMVLYGGFSAGYVEFQDLWTYEFQTGGWVEIPQTSTKPGDRGWASAIYNPRDTTMLLFGGQDLDGNFFNDIWILDLNQMTWRQIPPTSGWPDTRINPILVLDEMTNTVWMFGGFHRPGDFNFQELWSLDLNTFQWTQRPIGSPAPSARDNAPAFFDTISRSIVIFGGSDVNNNRALNDLWAYSVDGGSWRQLNASGEIPAPRRASPSAFVPSQNRLVLFGGIGLPNLTV